MQGEVKSGALELDEPAYLKEIAADRGDASQCHAQSDVSAAVEKKNPGC